MSPNLDSNRQEAGSALLVAVLILALMGVIGLAALDTVTRDRQVAGYQSRAQTALYAAEAGVAVALAMINDEVSELAPLGEGGLYDWNPSAIVSPATVPEFPSIGNAEELGDDFPDPGFEPGEAPTVIPEPDTAALLGLGLAGLAFVGRRKRELAA